MGFGENDHRLKVWFSSHHITSRYILPAQFITINIDPDHPQRVQISPLYIHLKLETILHINIFLKTISSRKLIEMKVKHLLNRDFFSHWGKQLSIVLLVSVTQQGELNTCIHMSLLPWISSPFRSQSIEWRSPSYTVCLMSYLFYT